ncbi:MAG: amino acid ABC transporter substrate-binding protein [Deltaproteobacteria bacterium]|nr:amino acid ABC transporter substrate-binding protein [Deltaproteobacteria bacterium]
MQKKMLLLFCLTLVSGISFIVVSFQHESSNQDRPITINEVAAAEQKLTPLADLANRQALYFGASISKTGHFRVEGQNVIEGYDLWQEHVNKNGGIKVGSKSYQVKIKYYDDNSQIDKLKENITKLIVEDKVDFILGSFSSGFNLAASKITEEYGKIMIESGGASDSIFTRNQHFTFATQTSASWWFKDFFDMASKLDPPPKTYALLTPDKLFTRSVAKGVQIWAASRNIKEIYFEVIDAETSNFTPYLLAMAERKPDIIILTSHYQDAVTFSRQLLRVKELNPKAIVMTIGPSEINFVNDVGAGADGMIGVTQWVAESSFRGPVFGTPTDYVKEFTAKYGQPPTYQDAQSSATGVIYQLALEKCDALDAREVLKNIRQLNVETFYGKIKYDVRGMNIGHKMALVQIQQGRMVSIWPPTAADHSVIYPRLR